MKILKIRFFGISIMVLMPISLLLAMNVAASKGFGQGHLLLEDTSMRSLAPAVEIGEPGVSFRYVEMFGETEVPYFDDSAHIYNPYGVGIDNNGNLWIGEWGGKRALQYAPDGIFLMSIGMAGFEAGEQDTFASVADVTMDGNGNVWIVDADRHRIARFDDMGEYQDQLGITWESGMDNDHFDTPRSIAFDNTGNMYVSDSSNHRIQVFDQTGVYTATLGETGVPGSDNSHFSQPRHLHIDSDDLLYVPDAANHRVQIFDVSDPQAISHVATIGETGVSGSDNDHFNWPIGVTVDTNRIYVVDSNHRVQIFDRVTHIYQATIGTGVPGPGNDQFYYPLDVVVDNAGNIYVADGINHRVQKFDSSLSYQLTFGTTGIPYATDSGHFNSPYGLALDNSGNIYLAEEDGGRLIKLGSDGVAQWEIGEAGVWASDDDHFSRPRGVAVDGVGNVYVADHNNHRVQIFDSAGNYVATLGSGQGGNGDYEFQNPSGVAIGPDGKLFIADTWNHRIQVYDSSRTYLATLGETDVIGTDNAHFNAPHGIYVDSSGNIYVPDSYNRRVQVFDSSYNYQFTVGTTGVEGDDFDHFSETRDVAVDNQGNIYVADSWNHRIQVFDSSGAYLTTIGGSWGGKNGQIRGVIGIEVDSEGTVYITDWGNHRIQKFTPGYPGWEQVNINGFGDPEDGIGPLEAFNSYLYAGIWGSDTLIWRSSNGNDWVDITPSWTITNAAIHDFQVFGTFLYVGMYANANDEGLIWRTDGTNWEQVVSSGFGDTNNQGINALAVFSSTLFVATSNSTTGVEIWSSGSGDIGDWQQVNSDGFGDIGTAQDVVMDTYNEELYVGLVRNNIAELWRTNDGLNWTAVFTDGLAANNTHVSAMAGFDGYLYIGLRNVTTGGEVWRSLDGLSWIQVFEGGLGNTDNYRPYGLYAFDGKLYLVFSNLETGAEVWESADGTLWQQIVGGGWGDVSNGFVDYFDKGAVDFNNDLYIATLTSANGGQIWKKTGDFGTVDPGTDNTINFPDESDVTTTLQIPPGAVSQTTTIVYTPASSSTNSTPANFTFAGRAFSLDAYQNEMLISPFTFTLPATITLHYTDTDVAGLDENVLYLEYWNGTTWEDAACGAYDRHPDENWLSVPICHLSEFALFEIEAEGDFIYLPIVIR